MFSFMRALPVNCTPEGAIHVVVTLMEGTLLKTELNTTIQVRVTFLVTVITLLGLLVTFTDTGLGTIR